MVVAAVAAAAFTCHPQPGLGSVAYTRAAGRHVVDLGTCKDTGIGTVSARVPRVSGVTVRSTGHGMTARQTIWFGGRPIFSETQYYKSIRPGDTPGPISLVLRVISTHVQPREVGALAEDRTRRECANHEIARQLVRTE